MLDGSVVWTTFHATASVRPSIFLGFSNYRRFSAFVKSCAGISAVGKYVFRSETPSLISLLELHVVYVNMSESCVDPFALVEHQPNGSLVVAITCDTAPS